MSQGRKRQLHSSESRPAYPRKRAAQACLICRRRRTKCDNEQPACTSCTSLGVDCVYREIDKASFDPASLAILQRLDDLEVVIKAHNSDSTSLLVANHQSTTALDHGSASSAGLEWGDPPETCSVNVEAVLGWPVLCMENFQPRQGLLDLLSSSGPRPNLRPLLAAEMNTKEASALLQLFLAHFHIYNPVLDVFKVEEHMKYTVLNGLEWDTQSCLLLLIYALGSLMGENDQSNLETSSMFREMAHFRRAEAFFQAAQKRMGPLLFGGGITEAQALFLAGVYLMTTMRPIQAWKLFVQALTCCQAFLPPKNDEEAQLYHGIYWTCFKSELEVRLELGIPESSMWNLRYPASFPKPPRHLHAEGEPTWYFYLAEIALRRLENRILTSTCQTTRGTNTLLDKVGATFEFERQVYSWAESLPESLRCRSLLRSPDRPDDRNGHFRFILNGHFLDCLEMIYWPFIEVAVNGHVITDQRSKEIADRGFDTCVRRIEENEWGFRHRHHGTWLMLRSCTRSAFVLVAAAQAGLGSRLPVGWQVSVSKVVQLLDYWKDEVPDAADRLEILKSLGPSSSPS